MNPFNLKIKRFFCYKTVLFPLYFVLLLATGLSVILSVMKFADNDTAQKSHFESGGNLEAVGEDYRLTRKGLLSENKEKLYNGKAYSRFQLIKNHLLDPPSKLPYNLKEDLSLGGLYTSYKVISPSWVFIDSVLMDLYWDKPPGFFVEAGALDGEQLSNTLQLERKLRWTGLLVEADAKSYQLLRGKNRKSWSSPCCLATKPYSHEAVLTSYSGGDDNWWVKGSSRLKQNDSVIFSIDGPGYPSFRKIVCIPVAQLLDSLNISHVDVFSLDVEGSEMDILSNFPFNRITVDVWVIEHGNKNDFDKALQRSSSNVFEDPNFISYMEKKGYYLLDVLCEVLSDYIFLRIKSKLFLDLGVPKSLRKRTGICSIKNLVDPTLPAKPKYLRDRRHWPSLKFIHNNDFAH